MSNLAIPFVVLALLSGLIGFSGVGGQVTAGFSKAMLGVFMIVFFIVQFFGEEKA
ncbi:MAG: DUF1328 domain-containing protein [Verrucomicrobiota bacterium]|jgi:uncharacterized membrane protein YtjA (UPF0391 family)